MKGEPHVEREYKSNKGVAGVFFFASVESDSTYQYIYVEYYVCDIKLLTNLGL